VTEEDIRSIHDILKPKTPECRIEAANMLLELSGTKLRIESPEHALASLLAFFHMLLDEEDYTSAALLIWGIDGFNPHPRSVQMIWEALEKHDKVMLVGAGSQGKTFTPAKWAVLDYERDPHYTTIKVVSTSGKHAESNFFSAIVSGFTESVLTLSPKPSDMTRRWIGVDPQNRHAGIELVAIGAGEDNRATLQGFHPRPRPRHPQFGTQTRIRIFLDEAEKIAPTAWTGVDNALGNRDELGTVKACAGTNPEKKDTPFGQRAEPLGGWNSIDIESTESWESKEGWHVVRLDAAKSENVIHARTVYNGMMSYEGFMDYKKKGLKSAAYQTFGRGFYPSDTAEFNIIPEYVFNNARGIYNFISVPDNMGSLDPAFALGGDNATQTTARSGMADSWKDESGIIHRFDHPKKVIQVEQQFYIPKGNTLDMGAFILKLCQDLGIRPEWFVMDRTGNAHGLFDWLVRKYGNVLGVLWGEAATDKKILDEDTKTAEEIYKGIVSEMWFAFARWLEYDYIKFAPMMDTDKLFTQLKDRRYIYYGLLQMAESKATYKERHEGKSCDEADSVIMLPHVMRMRMSDKGAMLPNDMPIARDERGFPLWAKAGTKSVVDKLEYVSFND
jgi:hypothetical protein